MQFPENSLILPHFSDILHILCLKEHKNSWIIPDRGFFFSFPKKLISNRLNLVKIDVRIFVVQIDKVELHDLWFTATN